jgi:hypothetical protein
MPPQKRPPADAVRIAAFDDHAALAGDTHAGDRQPACVDGGGDIEAPEDRDRAGVHRVAAQLVARKRAAIDDAHPRARARQDRRRNRTRRASTYDEDIKHLVI